jgi:hypothetical protein
MNRMRLAPAALLTLVLAGLLTIAGMSGRLTGSSSGVTGDGDSGSGMMGNGSGMMGNGSAMMGEQSGGARVDSLAAARLRAQVLADRLSLRVGDVVRFDNGFYAMLRAPDGSGVTEVLVDPANGAVRFEPGPAAVWSARSAVPADAGGAPLVTTEEAVRLADSWLAKQEGGLLDGLTTSTPERFPAYVTLRAIRDGRVAGLVSVNLYTGAVWYHSWHGTFVEMSEG